MLLEAVNMAIDILGKYLEAYRRVEEGGKCRLCNWCRHRARCSKLTRPTILCYGWVNEEIGLGKGSFSAMTKTEVYWLYELWDRTKLRVLGFGIAEMGMGSTE